MAGIADQAGPTDVGTRGPTSLASTARGIGECSRPASIGARPRRPFSRE
ncbi:hypothetical protein C7S14_3311 [Burkholderia cepacia]|nr:hypothetical protein C7S14_3311 [Burkholderia cepacia]